MRMQGKHFLFCKDTEYIKLKSDLRSQSIHKIIIFLLKQLFIL